MAHLAAGKLPLRASTPNWRGETPGNWISESCRAPDLKLRRGKDRERGIGDTFQPNLFEYKQGRKAPSI